MEASSDSDDRMQEEVAALRNNLKGHGSGSGFDYRQGWARVMPMVVNIRPEIADVAGVGNQDSKRKSPQHNLLSVDGRFTQT